MERYESYKDSEIEWIGEIPEEWEVKKLKYVADARPSNIDKKSKDEEKAVLLCNYVDVYKNEFISSELAFMTATTSEEQKEKFLLQKGDVLATKDSETPNDIAIPALVVEDFDNVVCGYHLTHIQPKKIIGSYLFRYFQTKYLRSYFEVSANGVTRYGLGVDKFGSALILNPSLEEQTAIANYLDRKTVEVDALIAQKERLIALYEEEKTAIINHAVTQGINTNGKLKDSGVDWLGEIPEGWEIKKLKYLTTYFKGFAFKSTDFKESGVPVVKASNLKNKIVVNVSSHIGFDNQKDEFEKVKLKSGDVIVSTVGSKPDVKESAVGQLASIDESLSGAYLNQNTLCIRPTSSVSDKYLKFAFFSRYMRSRFDAKSLWIANQAYLEVESIRDIEIPFPSKEEQTAIVQHIETETARIDAQIVKTKRIIELQKEYRTALISEVVTGKIKVSHLAGEEVAQ